MVDGIDHIVPSIVIGIGGTGQDIVNSLKKKIDNVLGDTPIIQFLVFDTDSKKQYSLVKESELLQLTVEYPAAIIKNIHKYPELKVWWPDELTRIENIGIWEKSIRAIGRFIFFQNINMIRYEISSRFNGIINGITLARANTRNIEDIPVRNDFKVFIVNSLSGGTGSGMFLDMAYNVRDIIGNFSISGYTILPGIFRMDEGNKARVSANTYAALLELDYYMKPGSKFKCSYTNTLHVESVRKPFDYYYIVGKNTEDYHESINYENATEMIANSIFLDITSNVGIAADADRRNLDFTLNTYLRPEEKKHIKAYGTLGYSSVYYPAPEIKKICTHKYAENLIDEILKPIDGMDKIIEAVVTNIKGKKSFDIEDIKKSLYNNTIQKQDYAKINGVVIEEIDDGKIESELMMWFVNEEKKVNEEIVKKIQDNRIQLLKDYKDVLNKEIENTVDNASKGFRVGYDVVEKMIIYVDSQKTILTDKNNVQGSNNKYELITLKENKDITLIDLHDIITNPFTIFKANSIRRYTDAYIDFCVAYLNKYIDIQKEKELNLLYIDLINILSTLKGNLSNLERNLSQIREEVIIEKEKSNHLLKNGSSFQLEKWIGTSIQIIDETYARHVTSIIDGKRDLCQNVLNQWKEYATEKIKAKLMDFSNEQYESRNMSLADVTSDLDNVISRVLDNSRVYMNYSKESIGKGFDRNRPVEVNILGVPENLMNQIEQIINQNMARIRVIPIKSDIRISNVVYKYGIPLIAIGSIQELSQYYEQAKESKERPLHVMKINFEDKDIMKGE